MGRQKCVCECPILWTACVGKDSPLVPEPVLWSPFVRPFACDRKRSRRRRNRQLLMFCAKECVHKEKNCMDRIIFPI